MQQAQDFLDESTALHALVSTMSEGELDLPMGFKGWTTNQVLRHLHVWNIAADLSLEGGEAFGAFFEQVQAVIVKGELPDFEVEYLAGLSGAALVEAWRAKFHEVAGHFANTDPSARVVWAGPSMSARSSITARLMETWAHGQSVYDFLAEARVNGDRIRNIVVLGCNTYGWTFKVNGLEPPQPVPSLKLTAPSGEVWSYGEPQESEQIEGLAEEFCQVVTQTRNIADTQLSVRGENATQWMKIAQCFAGRPETPPAPGTRKRASLRCEAN